MDFDLRTHLDAKQQPVKAYAYGQTFFTLLSPRIQNYTVGIEPAVPWWWDARKAEDDIAQCRRGELDGPARRRPRWAWAGGRSTGLFRRPYDYALDATGTTRSSAWRRADPRLDHQGVHRLVGSTAAAACR